VFTSSSDEKYQQAEEALNRAAEADKKAETAENKTEAEGYRELASRWREIAEHYEREVKDLRQKLDSLATQSAEKFQEDLEDLNLDEIIEEHNGKIQIEGKDLPPLPSPGR
jgi:F0F1-type ATP synthase membrane subunit b/b'